MSVPGKTEIVIAMKCENWAFGPVDGVSRDAATKVSERPAGSSKATIGN